MLRGIIFDVDGTLIDSNRAHASSWSDTLAEAGYEIPTEIILPMVGMGGDKLLPAVTGIESDSEAGVKLSKRRWEIFVANYLSALQPTPGARDLVKRLKDDGLDIVVATSAGGGESRILTEAAGVADLIEEATSSSDAEESKPDPDIVQAAVRKSGREPGELVMIGDTPYDIEAAIGAHVAIVALTCGGWSREHLSMAARVYADPAEVLVWYERDPRMLAALVD